MICATWSVIKPIWQRECIYVAIGWGLRLFMCSRTFQMMFSQMAKNGERTRWKLKATTNWPLPTILIDLMKMAQHTFVQLRFGLSLVIHLLMANRELNDSQSTTSDRMSASFPSFSVFFCVIVRQPTIVCEFTIQMVEMIYSFIFVIRYVWHGAKEKNMENETKNHFNVTVQLIHNK